MSVADRVHRGSVTTREQVLPRQGACQSCGHCYCRSGVRRVRRHRTALLTLLIIAALTVAGWGSLRASWSLFDRRADTTLCRLVQDQC